MRQNTDKTFTFDKAEDSPGFLLWQVTTLWQRAIREALAPFDLTHAQFVLLASIYWLTMVGQEITQVGLADHSKIDVMTTSQVVRTLESKGLVRRNAHTTDTRAKIVTLSEKGKKLVKPAVRAVEQCDHDFFAVLGDLGQFNRNLRSLLRRHT